MIPRIAPRLLVVIALVVMASAGAVSAYWSGTGSGQGQARLGDPVALTLSTGTAHALLHPGGDVSVSAIASNPNPYVVHIASLALDANAGTQGFDVDPAHSGCSVATLAFAPQDNGGAGWTIPPRSGTADGALPIDVDDALSMGAGASNACQGAVFTVHLVAGD